MAGAQSYAAAVDGKRESRPHSRVEILGIVNRLAFFDAFSADEKRQIVAEEARFKVYQPGEILIRQGSRDQSLFILLTGKVGVAQGTGDTLFAILGAGDIFGEMAFLTEIPRTAYVIAREPAITLRLDRMLFEQLPAQIREKFKDKIIEKLVLRLDHSNRQLARLQAAAGTSGAIGPFQPQPVSSGSLSPRPSPPAFLTGRELIRHIISQTSALPAMPQVMIKVRRMMEHPGSDLTQLVKLIETDPALVAGILKVANSAYYGFRGKVTTIRHASSLLGARRLSELITTMGAAAMMDKPLAGYALSAGDLWRHSIAVACMAGEIAACVEADMVEIAYLAGLLHDMGKIILDPYIHERLLLFDHTFAAHPGKTLQAAERDVLGVDHAAIATLLCEQWSLPPTIALGIRYHHQPAAAGDHLLPHIVHLADTVVRQTGVGGAGRHAIAALDPKSERMVPMSPDQLREAGEKTQRFVAHLSAQLLES